VARGRVLPGEKLAVIVATELGGVEDDAWGQAVATRGGGQLESRIDDGAMGDEGGVVDRELEAAKQRESNDSVRGNGAAEGEGDADAVLMGVTVCCAIANDGSKAAVGRVLDFGRVEDDTFETKRVEWLVAVEEAEIIDEVRALGHEPKMVAQETGVDRATRVEQSVELDTIGVVGPAESQGNSG